jgi:hypothetical protein
MIPMLWKKTVLLWVVVLAACTVQLVPSYDQALVEGLDDANTAALTLFASVEDGSPQSEFAGYEERYAQLIGKFEALHQRAVNRQIPPLAARISRLSIVRDYCNSDSDPTACVNASPASLLRVLAVIRRMREQHGSARGLAADIVGLFRNDYNTAVAQAITVENALKR